MALYYIYYCRHAIQNPIFRSTASRLPSPHALERRAILQQDNGRSLAQAIAVVSRRKWSHHIRTVCTHMSAPTRTLLRRPGALPDRYQISHYPSDTPHERMLAMPLQWYRSSALLCGTASLDFVLPRPSPHVLRQERLCLAERKASVTNALAQPFRFPTCRIS